jgi:hypothetical protein
VCHSLLKKASEAQGRRACRGGGRGAAESERWRSAPLQQPLPPEKRDAAAAYAASQLGEDFKNGIQIQSVSRSSSRPQDCLLLGAYYEMGTGHCGPGGHQSPTGAHIDGHYVRACRNWFYLGAM